MKKQQQPISKVYHQFACASPVLKNVRCKDGKSLETQSRQHHVDREALRLNSSDHLMGRLSGTEPVIRVMGEGEDKVLVEENSLTAS